MNSKEQMNLNQEIKKVQLNIASELHEICQKNNIEYFLVAGSLLGAVRHKGFIPWDDDIDIGMLRKDYEKFIEVAKKELNKKYFLQTWDTDSNFGLPIAKIRAETTEYVEYSIKDINIHKGIFIDIFPLDNTPENFFEKSKHKFITYFLKRTILIKQNYVLWGNESVLKKFLYKAFSLLLIGISVEPLKLLMKKEMTKYNNCESLNVVGIGGSYSYDKETIKKEWIKDKVLLEFESQKFYAPLKYHEYLNNLYGDYMTPPPESQREDRHKIIKIKL